MKTEAASQILKFLRAKIKGCAAVTFKVATVQRTIKGCPFASLVCVQKVNGMIGANYQNMVNNIAKREKNGQAGTFQAESMSGRVWIPGLEMIGSYSPKTGQEYLEVNPAANGTTVLGFVADGQGITAEEAKQWIYRAPSKSYGKQSAFGNDKLVRRKCYKVEGILSVTVGGETYYPAEKGV